MSYLQGQQPGYGAPTQGQPAYRPPGQSGYQQGYGGQQGYTAPSAPQGYGAPGTAPGHPQQGYGQPGHGAPQGGGHAGYGAPQGGGHAGYGAPPGGGQAGYGAPPGGGQPGYGAPPGGGQPGYGAPPGGGQPGYGAPPGGGQPGYGAPPGGGQPGYGTPPGAARPGYGAPPSGAPPGVDPTLYNWFMAVDRDKSGAITANELREALMNNNWSHFNAETCRLMISMFDRDNSGTINLQEFSALWKYIQDWRGCFDRYDRDRSGNIDANELHTAFSEMGFRVSQGFSQMVVTRYDRASIRTVKFDDFIQICVLLRSLTDAFKQRDTNLNGVIKLSYEDFLSMAITYKP